MGQETTFGYTLDVEVSRTIWNAAWNAALKSAGQGLLWNPEKTSEWNTCFQLKAKKLYYLKLEDSAYADFMEWKYPLLSDKGNLSHTTWDTAWNTALNVVETEIRKDYCWIPEMV